MIDDISHNMNKVDELTLACLINPEHYSRYMVNRKNDYQHIRDKDRRFYKKRILALTKEMVKGRYPTRDLQTSFNVYVDTLIDYFKFIDQKDIIQEEYTDISGAESIPNNIHSYEEANELIMHKPQTVPTMDDYVTRSIPFKKNIVLPQQRKINLRDPSLKRKGIKKKKNKSNE